MTRTMTRGLVTEALTESGNTITAAAVDDGGGGASFSETASATIICRLDSLGGGEGERADRLSDRSTHLLTLPAGAAVTTADTFQITGRGTFEVTAVRENTGELARFAEVVAL